MWKRIVACSLTSHLTLSRRDTGEKKTMKGVSALIEMDFYIKKRGNPQQFINPSIFPSIPSEALWKIMKMKM